MNFTRMCCAMLLGLISTSCTAQTEDVDRKLNELREEAKQATIAYWELMEQYESEVRRLNSENEQLRQEIAALRNNVSQPEDGIPASSSPSHEVQRPGRHYGEPLLLTNLSDPPELQAMYARWGVQEALLMGGVEIDPQHENRWTAEHRTRAWLDKYCPRDFAGFVCLDWESPFKILRQGSGPEFDRTLSEMVRLLRYVKSQRPRAKFGYYGLPVKEYWNQDEKWRSAMRACQPIFDASDVLMPSVYDFYDKSEARDHEKLGAVVKLSLELANGKPVLLYVSARYHNSTPIGYRTIPDAEFVNHVRSLMNVSHNGDRADGVIAWKATRYFHDAGQRRKSDGSYLMQGADWDRVRRAFRDEMSSGESIDQFILHTHRRTYELLAEAMDLN